MEIQWGFITNYECEVCEPETREENFTTVHLVIQAYLAASIHPGSGQYHIARTMNGQGREGEIKENKADIYRLKAFHTGPWSLDPD